MGEYFQLYDDEQTFEVTGGTIEVSLQFNSGSLDIAKKVSDGTFSDPNTLAASDDGIQTLSVKAGVYKFTPSGGCKYQVAR